jgi:hypothetical protein
MMLSVPQIVDIRVRKGAGRLHKINLALDRLKATGGPTTLRVVIQARLPRGQTRPVRYEYQRVGSWLIDCRTARAAVGTTAWLGAAIRKLDRLKFKRENQHIEKADQQRQPERS